MPLGFTWGAEEGEVRFHPDEVVGCEWRVGLTVPIDDHRPVQKVNEPIGDPLFVPEPVPLRFFEHEHGNSIASECNWAATCAPPFGFTAVENGAG